MKYVVLILTVMVAALALHFPAHAQVGKTPIPITTDFVVPVITETYTVPITIDDITSVITITVKGSNVLHVTTDLIDAELGEVDRTPHLTHTLPLTSAYTAQVGVPEFPSGALDELDVIEIFVNPYDANWETTTVDVVIRNNTDDFLGPLTISAEAYEEDGNFLGLGDSTFGFHPELVEPGGIAIGSVVFRGFEVLDTDTIEFLPEESWLAGSQYPLLVEKWARSARTGNSITGTIMNPHDIKLDIDSVHLLCFDDERIPQDGWLGGGDTPAEDLAPGESAPFQFDTDCETFIISASGSK